MKIGSTIIIFCAFFSSISCANNKNEQQTHVKCKIAIDLSEVEDSRRNSIALFIMNLTNPKDEIDFTNDLLITKSIFISGYDDKCARFAIQYISPGDPLFDGIVLRKLK